MNNASNPNAVQLTTELLRAADHAIAAAASLREVLEELDEARRELKALLREARRPPEPWRALNLN